MVRTPIKQIMKGLPSDKLAAEGLFYHDWDALTSNQRECTSRLGMTMQLEQEEYMLQHPEVIALLELFIAKMARLRKRKDILKEAVDYFCRPLDELETEIRKKLGLPMGVPYVKDDTPEFRYRDFDLETDLRNIATKHCQATWIIPTPVTSVSDTMSSSFISIITSDTTLPTPEPIPTPEATLSETFFVFVSNAVDKAIYLHVDDAALRYDIAYVELSKTIESVMEIPVIEIKEDIAELFYNAYRMFEVNIMEKERIAAEIAWEKRMKKKLKRTLRRLDNFKGYATPPTPKSEMSSHESYKKPPPPPCVCHPHNTYNRYAKDRFGIYLPRDVEFSDANVTATPAISMENIEEQQDEMDTKSIMSKKSVVSNKSTKSAKKTTIKE